MAQVGTPEDMAALLQPIFDGTEKIVPEGKIIYLFNPPEMIPGVKPLLLGLMLDKPEGGIDAPLG